MNREMHSAPVRPKGESADGTGIVAGGSRPRRGSPPPRGKSPLRVPSLCVEPLEPRVLLSGSWFDGGAAAADSTGSGGSEAAPSASDLQPGDDGLGDPASGGTTIDAAGAVAGHRGGPQSPSHFDLTRFWPQQSGPGSDDPVLGTEESDTFSIGRPVAGTTYSVDGAGGNRDTIRLDGVSFSQASWGKDKVSIDMGDGRSFSVRYSNVEAVQFKDRLAAIGGARTVLEGTEVALKAPESNFLRNQDLDIRYVWKQVSGPPVALNDSHAASPEFSAPEVESPESLVFQVTATLGKLSAVGIVEVDVAEELEAKAGESQAAAPGEAVLLDATASGWRSRDAFDEVTRLLANDGAAGDTLGFSVSIDGRWAALSAHNSDSGVENGGAVYLFERKGGDWIQSAKLTPDDAEANRFFGYSVDVSGKYVVVGAIGDDEAGVRSGAAYIFSRVDGEWTQVARLTAPDGEAGDLFGVKVSISGGVAAIGASQDDDQGSASGSVHIYERHGDSWVHTAKLAASDGMADAFFGHQLAVSGKTIVVGAFGHAANAANAGAAYVFEKVGGTWSETARLVPSSSQEGAFFGSALAISGNTVVVGAAVEDGHGAAYVFVKHGGVWRQTARLVAGDAEDGDRFGTAVDISNGTIVVGAYLDDEGGTNAGAAYVFRRDGSSWRQVQKLVTGSVESEDRFGLGVAISRGTILAGAPMDDDLGSDSGSVTVFKATHPGLSYRWKQTGGPSVDLSDARGPTPSFQVPAGSEGSSLSFQVAVSDGVHSSVDSTSVAVGPLEESSKPFRGGVEPLRHGMTGNGGTGNGVNEFRNDGHHARSGLRGQRRS